MRLVICSTEFPPGPGGIGTHAYQLARHLSAIGWDVNVFTAQDYSPSDEIAAFNRSQAFTIRRFRALPGAAMQAVYRGYVAGKWAKRLKPDVLLASGDPAIYLAPWLTRCCRSPWVAVEHGRIPVLWECKIKRWAMNQADAIVSVSQYTAGQVPKMGVRPRLQHTIPNGADSDRFRVLPEFERKQGRHELGLPPGHLLITVGNVSERKGQDIVIRALPRVLRIVPDTHYLVVGLPTRRAEFTALAESLGVGRNVHFLGVVDSDALVLLLNCSDVFVMTSRHTKDQFEGYGIAVVEAALCGKPSVVAGNSGLAEAIVDGETGLTVSEADEGATADAIVRLLGDAGRRESMGQAAVRLALERQTWRRAAGEYDAFLRSLLRHRAAASLPDSAGNARTRRASVS